MTIAMLVSVGVAEQGRLLQNTIEVEATETTSNMCEEPYNSDNPYGNSPAQGEKIKFVFDNKSNVPILLQKMQSDGSLKKGVVVKAIEGWTIRSSVVNGVWMVSDDNTKEVIKHIKVGGDRARIEYNGMT